MKSIILAAGKGSRLGDYSGGIPKSLLPIDGEGNGSLYKIINLLSKTGINDFFILGGYKFGILKQKVKEISRILGLNNIITIDTNPNWTQGPLYTLLSAEEMIKENNRYCSNELFLIHGADTIFSLNFLRFLKFVSTIFEENYEEKEMLHPILFYSKEKKLKDKCSYYLELEMDDSKTDNNAAKDKFLRYYRHSVPFLFNFIKNIKKNEKMDKDIKKNLNKEIIKNKTIKSKRLEISGKTTTDIKLEIKQIKQIKQNEYKKYILPILMLPQKWFGLLRELEKKPNMQEDMQEKWENKKKPRTMIEALQIKLKDGEDIIGIEYIPEENQNIFHDFDTELDFRNFTKYRLKYK